MQSQGEWKLLERQIGGGGGGGGGVEEGRDYSANSQTSFQRFTKYVAFLKKINHTKCTGVLAYAQ